MNRNVEPLAGVTDSDLHSFSARQRIHLFLTGAVFPIICFAIAGSDLVTALPQSPWQSGQTADYVAMLLAWPGFGPFLPLVAYSIVCLSWWTWRRETARFRAVRLGIYTGVVLAIQFLVFILLTSGPVTFFCTLLVWPLVIGFVYATHAIGSRVHRFTIRHLLILTTVVAILIALIQATQSWPTHAMALISVLFYVSAATPVLTVITYGRASYHISCVQTGQRSNAAGAVVLSSWLGWLVGWFVSWRVAIAVMMDEYSKLPTTDPNCYVCSAAASGHEKLVRPSCHRIGGVRINEQMKRLKFLEFAVAAAAPRAHALLRNRYDSWGPILARLCRHNVWFADASYLMFKPLEWTAAPVRRAAGVTSAQVTRIYQDTQSVTARLDYRTRLM